MDQSLDIILFQKYLQLISFFTENGKLMINIILISKALGQGNQWIFDVFIIVCSQFLTCLIILIQIF